MNTNRELRLGFLAGLLTMVVVTVIAATVVVSAMTIASVSAAIGDWEGRIDTGNGSLRVIVHISQAADGRLIGSLDSPDQGSTGIATSSASYNEPDLHFSIESLGSSYDGKMNHDNSEITGYWKQSGLSLQLVFKRRSK